MKTLVVTGVSRGLGFEIARYFAGLGWNVFGCSRSVSKVGRDLAGAGVEVQLVDVSSDEGVARWAGDILHRSVAPDLLINNAALMTRPSPLWELSAGDVVPVIEANVLGTIHVIRHFLPAMIARGTGVVVNMSSGWGRSTSPDVAVYCASKWAIEGLTSSLAQELPEGLAAVALNPGIIATEMLRTCWADGADAYPPASQWIRAAGPFLAGLGPEHNGRVLTVPGAVAD